MAYNGPQVKIDGDFRPVSLSTVGKSLKIIKSLQNTKTPFIIDLML
jgi:hypothetical protein